MPKGTTYTSSVKWPSREFWDTYGELCERLGATRTERLEEHAATDFELHGTPEEKALARDHRASRARAGRRATKPTPPPAASPAEELKQWAELANAGTITQEEFAAKKTQLLGL